MLSEVAKTTYKEMQLKHNFWRRKFKKVRVDVLNICMNKYRKCMQSVKKYINNNDTHMETQRKRTSAKLQPLRDKPIRRVASKLKRRPTDELTRLRRKGDDWNANDLFRFQYSDPEAGSPEERKELCYAWLDRLHDISKKYCYLAWYEAAIYACYYRLAPILLDVQEKKSIWYDVRREYAEIFLMGRRIWRRPIHPSRLRVFYDMAMLCVRFGDVEDDTTVVMFRDLLADATNFDFKVLNEVEFAKSIEKITRLENYVIDQFYSRRRSSGCSVRTSFKRRARRSTVDVDLEEKEELVDQEVEHELESRLTGVTLLEERDEEVDPGLVIPTIVIDAPTRSTSFVSLNNNKL